MLRKSRVVLLGCLALGPCVAQEWPAVYRLDTPDYRIEMTVRFFPPYLGERQVSYSSANPRKELCYSGNGESSSCIERFVGALAAVTYRFQPRRKDLLAPATFREVVKVLSRSEGLGERPPHIREQPLVQGVGSDIQAFGYDEGAVAEPERAALRAVSRAGMWRVYGQELFLNGDSEPFGVVKWKSPAASPREQDVKYGFATRDYSIEMSVAFFDPYLGRRLAFSSSVDPRKEVCYSADGGTTGRCIERFVGAIAVVRYSLKLANGGTPRLVTIRERVTVSAQSAGLPERAPFSMRQKLVEGIGSDIQVFGYDEGPLKRADRTGVRRQAQETWWRLCRQELYVDEETKPFAIVEWKHTLNRISIIQIYAPPDRE